MGVRKDFSYRGTLITLDRSLEGHRIWIIYPIGQPQQQGFAPSGGGSGSFSRAMSAAEAAIDAILRK